MTKRSASARFVPLLLTALVGWGVVSATGWAHESPGRGETIAVGELPAAAGMTYRLIQQGGPFPYAKDGVVFGNYERQLPRQARGYYREYTVPTPRSEGGDGTRGARRIVCGGDQRAADDCHYTEDHYTSFKRIRQQ